MESSRLPVLRRADPAHLETDLLTYTQSVEYDEHVLCNVLEVVNGTCGCLYIVELMKTLEECLIMFYMDQWMSWSDEVHTSSLNVWFYVAVIASFGLVNSLGLNDGFNCESSALQ